MYLCKKVFPQIEPLCIRSYLCERGKGGPYHFQMGTLLRSKLNVNFQIKKKEIFSDPSFRTFQTSGTVI